MRNPMRPSGSGNIFAELRGYREIASKDLPEPIKPDFAEMIESFAEDGINVRTFKKPDGSYSLMADPETWGRLILKGKPPLHSQIKQGVDA
ncbi:MAG: hypothetical protein EPN26_11260 [Rhodospirillales bacterium]|nr:MAG: hypothetical protein EPN26_11260 [Rhodospirillales bacterium]